MSEDRRSPFASHELSLSAEFLMLIRLPPSFTRPQIDNLKMKIRCCDGSIIMCNLSEAITQHLAGGTKVQIEGVPKSKNTVQISDFIVLQDLNDDFHMDIYNETVKMLAETEQHNTYLVRNVEEHWGSCNEKEIDFVDELDRLSTNNASNGNANAKGGQGAEHEDTFF